MTFIEQQLIRSLGIDVYSRSVTIGENKINYIICGSGKPLILVHGGTFGWGMWHSNIPDLAKHFTVYAIDLPIAGPDFKNSFEGLIESFIEANNLKNPHLIGHSFGGWMVLKTALNSSNVGKIILIDS